MRAKRGMTLLEVLIALAIFATAAIATIRSVSQHINTLEVILKKKLSLPWWRITKWLKSCCHRASRVKRKVKRN